MKTLRTLGIGLALAAAAVAFSASAAAIYFDGLGIHQTLLMISGVLLLLKRWTCSINIPTT